MSQRAGYQSRDDSQTAEEERTARLEAAANMLLAEQRAGAQEGAYPWHTETWIRRQERRDAGQAAEVQAAGEARDEVRLCARLLETARLNDRQRRALRLRLEGLPQREIAARLGVSESWVSRLVAVATARLAEELADAATKLDEEELLREVYWEDIARRAYYPEVHCHPGREQCRRTGLCSRRWYLGE
ncbi:MAG TPA: sigma factor-like helix-turn-helix DNA-binding protein [Armatimonadota bacterium]|jgi:RNA polymerase sigma factor (sigma-70 family)